jgi:hypothetical protein
MDKSKSVEIPIISNEEKNLYKKEDYSYREVVASLLYLSTKTRPDISYAVGYSSRYIENYSQHNINDLKHIIKYLNGTTDQGIQYEEKQDVIYFKLIATQILQEIK